MKIMEFSPGERPRERLRQTGAASLSNAELLAILLRTGVGETNVLMLAQKILAMGGGELSRVGDMSIERLCEIDGIGPGKASVIIAAIELGRRYCSEVPDIDRTSFTGPEMVYRLMAPGFKGMAHEQLWALFLNQANYLVGRVLVSSGGISATALDTRSLVISALDKKATAVILVHNHPSGSPRPGKADIMCTEAVKRALSTFDIKLLDHVVISDGRYFSFHEEKVCKVR